MIHIQEQQNDFTGATYIGVSRHYRWWVFIPHKNPDQIEVQVHKAVIRQGRVVVGKCVYSNLPEGKPVNRLDARLRNRITAVMALHHKEKGRAVDFSGYEDSYRCRKAGGAYCNVYGGNDCRSGFNVTMWT